jgi:hypothetical protein
MLSDCVKRYDCSADKTKVTPDIEELRCLLPTADELFCTCEWWHSHPSRLWEAASAPTLQLLSACFNPSTLGRWGWTAGLKLPHAALAANS